MPWLVCTRGTDKGLNVELRARPVTLGRDAGCDLQLLETHASRRHCEASLHHNTLHVQDLGSSNGIKYKKKRYKGKTIKLELGEHFAIGDDRFVYAKSNGEYVEGGDVMADLALDDDPEVMKRYMRGSMIEAHEHKPGRHKRSLLRRLVSLFRRSP